MAPAFTPPTPAASWSPSIAGKRSAASARSRTRAASASSASTSSRRPGAARGSGSGSGVPAWRGSVPPQIVPLATVDSRLLAADDRRVFPAPRDAFLRAWVGMPDATGLAWLEDGRLAGWGLVRRCREGHKIAPLLADDPQVARA